MGKYCMSNKFVIGSENIHDSRVDNQDKHSERCMSITHQTSKVKVK